MRIMMHKNSFKKKLNRRVPYNNVIKFISIKNPLN